MPDCSGLSFTVIALKEGIRHATHPPTYSNKELVYFTGKVHEHKMARLKIRRREGFQLEVRDSNVLVLSIKAKADLNLEEALQIVLMSDLKDHLQKIELVAVIPAGVRAKRSATISHAYVQFVDNDSAKACINVVDAMEYKGYRVHSPQLDAAVLVKCDLGASIWQNPGFKRPFMPLCDDRKLSCSTDDTEVVASTISDTASTLDAVMAPPAEHSRNGADADHAPPSRERLAVLYCTGTVLCGCPTRHDADAGSDNDSYLCPSPI